MNETETAAIDALKERLSTIYGDRLEQVVLYGSYARGDQRPSLDIDLLIVLDGTVDPYEEIDRISDACYDIELEHGVLLGIVPTSAEAYRAGSTPLLRNARREGVEA